MTEKTFENVYTTGVVLSFTKKDGTERVMFCTLNFKDIPEKYHPKDKDSLITENSKDVKYYHVFDCEKLGWRCVPREGYSIIRDMEDGEAIRTIRSMETKEEEK